MAKQSFVIDLSMKDWFFDSSAVIRRMDATERRALSRIGAFIRRTARSSLRRRKKVSKPGQALSIRSKDKFATLKNILFAYDRNQHSVIVGPVRLNRNRPSRIIRGTIPNVLELGGVEGIREKQLKSGRWVTTGADEPRPGQAKRVRRVVYKARPFMNPALQKEANAGTIPRAFLPNAA